MRITASEGKPTRKNNPRAKTIFAIFTYVSEPWGVQIRSTHFVYTYTATRNLIVFECDATIERLRLETMSRGAIIIVAGIFVS